MTRVAIVIVTYNSSAEIGGCLDALVDLTNVEIVVIDNASTDTTTAEVTCRNISLTANTTNIGFAAAVNQGVCATTAPLVLLLNPDAHLVNGPDSLEALAARCETPGVGAAGGLLLGPGGQPQAGFMARNLPSPAALIFEILGLNQLWPANPVNWHYRCKALNPMTSALVEQPAGAFLMFPRSVWRRLGGFDERFRPVWFEDVDFCARIKATGLSVFYEPRAAAKHAGSHSIQGLSLVNKETYWYGNLLKYAAKHYGSVAFRTLCAAVVLGSGIRALRGIPREGLQSLEVYAKVVRLAAGRFFKPRKSRGPSVA